MKKLYIIIIFQLFFTTVFAQFSIIEFKVIDSETKKPFKKAEIQSKKFKKSYFTDQRGTVSIATGTDTVAYQIWAEDYELTQAKICALADTTVVINLHPVQKSVVIEEVTVLAKAVHKQREELSIVPKEMQLLPSIGGNVDIGKLLVKQGGVHELNEGAGDILVRGGLPKHTSYIMQNRTTFSTSAAKGLVSPFNANVIQQTVLNKSYVPPMYSDFLSGVVAMKPMVPNASQQEFKLNINPFLGSVFFSTPVVKEKSSLAISARHTIFPYIAKLFKDLDFDIKNVKYTDFSLITYTSLSKQLGLSANFDLVNDKESEIEIEEYTDYYSYHEQSRLQNAANGELNLQFKADKTEWEIYTSFSYLQTKYLFINESDNFVEQNSKNKSVDLSTFNQLQLNAGFSVSHKIKNHTINYGSKIWQLTVSPYKQSYTNNTNYFERIINPSANAFYIQPYAELNSNFEKSKLSYRGGFAFQTIVSNGIFKFLPEPRLLAAYAVTDKFSVETAYTRSHRLLQYISNTTVGFPRQMPILPSNYTPASTDQFSLTLQASLGKDKKQIELSAGAFYKTTNRALWFKPNYTINHVLLQVGAEKPEDALQTYQILTTGIELAAHKNKGSLQYSLNYTFSNSNLVAGNRKTLSPFDIPHQFNAELRKNLGKKISMGINWAYHTGMPVRVPTYGYSILPVLTGTGLAPTNYSGYSSITLAYYEDKIYRLPAYHRLDISMEFKLKPIIASKRHAIRLDIINVYSRLNQYYVNFDFKGYDAIDANLGRKPEVYNQLKGGFLFPILPTVSYVLEF